MCFVRMDIHRVICAVVESMLPRFSDENTVLVISLNLRMCQKGKSSLLDAKRIEYTVHLMFHRPGNYTKVLRNVVRGMGSHHRDFQSWELLVDHDSCWRDSVRSSFFELAQEMLRELKTVRPEVKGCPDVETSIDFHPIDGDPKLVRLRSYKLDSENRTFKVAYASAQEATA